jgi:2,3-bisphosphoglycerate-independent phosphoglycerate mutase
MPIIHRINNEHIPYLLVVQLTMAEPMQSDKPLLLIVLDGWGYRDTKTHNAISQAITPNWQQLWHHHPHTLLSASGLDVGLPPGQMGNSEVGHMTLGAGRVIFQDLTRINNSITDKSFFNNKTLQHAIDTVKQNNSALHILGLLSPGGIHSHEDHIKAMIEMAQMHNVDKIYLHAFLDGRDMPPKSAQPSIEKFAPYITSIMGRFYAMDRDQRLERTQAAIDLLIKAQAPFNAPDPMTALTMAYARDETDEFVQPTIIKPVKITASDVVVFMNFRTDRTRQLCHALLNAIPNLAQRFFTMTEYAADIPAHVIFPPQVTDDTLSEVLQQNNLHQLHIAESEKYAHVTFFFNAGKEAALLNEERILVPSPKVATYDLAPQMSAQKITDHLLAAIKQKNYDFIICNYANADMVGHTGNLAATIQAIETIDSCLGQIMRSIDEYGGQMLITADHGNAETMWNDQTQQPHTAHTTNLVPLIYYGSHKIQFKLDRPYGLQDVAPTILEILGINKPAAMTGISLLQVYN